MTSYTVSMFWTGPKIALIAVLALALQLRCDLGCLADSLHGSTPVRTAAHKQTPPCHDSGEEGNRVPDDSSHSGPGCTHDPSLGETTNAIISAAVGAAVYTVPLQPVIHAPVVVLLNEEQFLHQSQPPGSSSIPLTLRI